MEKKILLIILTAVVLMTVGVLIWGFGDSMPKFTGSETLEEEISNEITPGEEITDEKEPALSDTLNLCKKINQPCQSYSQGVGGGDNCCEGLKCDGSGPDGTTGKCIKSEQGR